MKNWPYRGATAFVLGTILAASPLVTEIAQAEQTVGDAQVVVNDVQGAVGKSAPTTLRAGVDVFQNEVIRTGGNSASKVLFQDNTSLSVGASSEVTLDRFVFDPDPQKSQVALSIAKGVVRFATGNLPKPSYKISTPTATIGIRGTVLSITVGADGATSVSVEEGAALVSSGGATVTVNPGMTTTTSAGSAPTAPSTTPPSPPVTEMDTLLASNDLKPGGPAGPAAAIVGVPIVAAGIAAVVIAAVVVAVTGGSHSSSTTTTSVH